MMGTPALDRKLLAILAADMDCYSKAMEADEAGTIKRLKAIRAELINPAISERHGTIIKLMGDGALVAFDSLVDALPAPRHFKMPWRRATPACRSSSACVRLPECQAGTAPHRAAPVPASSPP
ncbi:class 3 adenylate cyclase [Rhizobium sp. BK619]|nr:class 3 adenylate cyclase [Rhizobium sp. BK619]